MQGITRDKYNLLYNECFLGAVADLAKKTINADIPHFPWLTGYIAIIMGAVLTFVVQSSSVFTSTLTPLVGCGLISVERYDAQPPHIFLIFQNNVAGCTLLRLDQTLELQQQQCWQQWQLNRLC